MNTFGTKFRLSIFGESHGEAIGVVLDGVPPGMELSTGDFTRDLTRRQGFRAEGAKAEGTTARSEKDWPNIVSGIYQGRTTGAPVAILFENGDARPGDYSHLENHPRPSHADFAASRKFAGYNDPRGGGHFSGRLTLGIVAAGVVAKKMLAAQGIAVKSSLAEVGGCTNPAGFEQAIAEAAACGDSLGGIVECAAEGVPAGWGEPFFDSVESVAAHLMFSIPGVKGVEFGAGFAAARQAGSQHNDAIIDRDGHTATNNSGGINGGVSNGNPILCRVAFKPTPSIALPQQTFNFLTGKTEELRIAGRHDACIALRGAVVVEGALAVALVQFMS